MDHKEKKTGKSSQKQAHSCGQVIRRSTINPKNHKHWATFLLQAISLAIQRTQPRNSFETVVLARMGSNHRVQ